jgi:hypothetical protein
MSTTFETVRSVPLSCEDFESCQRSLAVGQKGNWGRAILHGFFTRTEARVPPDGLKMLHEVRPEAADPVGLLGATPWLLRSSCSQMPSLRAQLAGKCR